MAFVVHKVLRKPVNVSKMSLGIDTFFHPPFVQPTKKVAVSV